MERTGLWGWPWLLLLLLLLWVSGFEAVGEEEKQICLQEGRNLSVSCVYNIMLYESSLKAWQRVGSQGSAETLVRTNTRNTDRNVARVGRYFLEDDPTIAVVSVTVTELQRQDLGLYQCVIDLSSRSPLVLLPRIRLVQCEDLLLAFDHSNLLMLAIVLTCGFVLNKGLVSSVLFLLLRKSWVSGEANPAKQQSQPSRS
ncbi:hypothetical protein mRhiFer1_017525 [Rhinolophus ferrumequinum]|uniref:Ig-like domain-containing protein n=4 Tax=Rhinolophus ferrumequinum TaxID=59479 RepID=A0A7J7YU61_RHIFE|nr:hypothetical protein mRhiFer1_017525 [Rhinolophus ferrumequinum]